MSVLAGACLVLAAVVAGWPAPGRRARWRRLIAAAPAAGSAAGRWPDRLRWPPVRWSGSPRAGLVSAASATVGPVVLAAWLGGPVAAVVVGGYAVVAVREFRRGRRQHGQAYRRGELLDLLGAAAADLRAGLSATTALAGVVATGPAGVVERAGSVEPAELLRRRVEAAVRLAEQTGAPLAEVIERIEADARVNDRARSAASAQVAGARATAWLLAGLPLAGLALGYLIGTDPLSVLLRTPVGAACAVGAVMLQLAGLGWTSRITRPESAGAS